MYHALSVCVCALYMPRATRRHTADIIILMASASASAAPLLYFRNPHLRAARLTPEDEALAHDTVLGGWLERMTGGHAPRACGTRLELWGAVGAMLAHADEATLEAVEGGRARLEALRARVAEDTPQATDPLAPTPAPALSEVLPCCCCGGAPRPAGTPLEAFVMHLLEYGPPAERQQRRRRRSSFMMIGFFSMAPLKKNEGADEEDPPAFLCI